ncbi:MAG: sialate O-acetylesterase [Chthoniobacteraceae bacterium]
MTLTFPIRSWLLGLGFALAPLAGLVAAPRPAAVFGDNAVLQRGIPVAVWGWGNPGEVIQVRYGKHSALATTGSDGHWQTRLPALQPEGPGELVFEGESRVVSANVIVGDVWLCSGQSNMAWSLGESLGKQAGAEEIIAKANVPEIRQFRGMVHVTFPEQPRLETDAKWVVVTPDTAKGFSLVSYLFARQLFDRYHVPQGVICNAVAGTFIESWMSTEALAAAGIQEEQKQRWETKLADYPQRKAAYDQAMQAWNDARKQAEAEGKPFTERRPSELVGPGHRDTPSGCFNAMTAPVVPYTLKGMLWYQGEQNIGLGLRYADRVQALWGDLRNKFAAPDLPILYVQLPNFEASGADRSEWAVLRQGQANAQNFPHVSMAVAIDLGDPKNIHPPDKRELARRLALLAFHDIYGEAEVLGHGPRLIKATATDSGVRLTFESLVKIEEPKTAGNMFEVSGEDRRFIPAKVTQTAPDTIDLQSEPVHQVRWVRYLWSNAPAAIIYSRDALPAAPFEAEVNHR